MHVQLCWVPPGATWVAPHSYVHEQRMLAAQFKLQPRDCCSLRATRAMATER